MYSEIFYIHQNHACMLGQNKKLKRESRTCMKLCGFTTMFPKPPVSSSICLETVSGLYQQRGVCEHANQHLLFQRPKLSLSCQHTLASWSGSKPYRTLAGSTSKKLLQLATKVIYITQALYYHIICVWWAECSPCCPQPGQIMGWHRCLRQKNLNHLVS